MQLGLRGKKKVGMFYLWPLAQVWDTALTEEQRLTVIEECQHYYSLKATFWFFFCQNEENFFSYSNTAVKSQLQRTICHYFFRVPSKKTTGVGGKRRLREGGRLHTHLKTIKRSSSQESSHWWKKNILLDRAKHSKIHISKVLPQHSFHYKLSIILPDTAWTNKQDAKI